MAVRPPTQSKIVFDKYDKDRSGFIDINEFQNLVKSLGHDLSDLERENAVRLLSREDGNGKISYPSFQKWWSLGEEKFAKLKLSADEVAGLKRATNYFEYFDKSKNGVLDREEFRTMHSDLVKNKMTTLSFDDCLKDFDQNQTAEISFNEYLEWFVRKGFVKLSFSG